MHCSLGRNVSRAIKSSHSASEKSNSSVLSQGLQYKCVTNICSNRGSLSKKSSEQWHNFLSKIFQLLNYDGFDSLAIFHSSSAWYSAGDDSTVDTNLAWEELSTSISIDIVSHQQENQIDICIEGACISV